MLLLAMTGAGKDQELTPAFRPSMSTNYRTLSPGEPRGLGAEYVARDDQSLRRCVGKLVGPQLLTLTHVSGFKLRAWRSCVSVK